MIRLHITAEGQTEQRFVKNVLTPYLCSFNVFADARCVLTSEDNRSHAEYRGGLTDYEKAKRDIQNWLKEDTCTDCRFTTMFDLYALPNNFPGFKTAKGKTNVYERVQILEECLKYDIGDWRFIPYIQIHEYEALIFSDPRQLDWEYLEHERAIANLIAIARLKAPELINDGPNTAPSKRILKEIPEYDKATAGPVVVGKIGISILRKKCPHFNEWISLLEQLDGTTP